MWTSFKKCVFLLQNDVFSHFWNILILFRKKIVFFQLFYKFFEKSWFFIFSQIWDFLIDPQLQATIAYDCGHLKKKSNSRSTHNFLLYRSTPKSAKYVRWIKSSSDVETCWFHVVKCCKMLQNVVKCSKMSISCLQPQKQPKIKIFLRIFLYFN